MDGCNTSNIYEAVNIIDYDAGDLAFCESQCFLNLSLHRVGQKVLNTAHMLNLYKLPRHIFEHNYSEHGEVEARVVRMNQYRRRRESLCEQSYQN